MKIENVTSYLLAAAALAIGATAVHREFFGSRPAGQPRGVLAASHDPDWATMMSLAMPKPDPRTPVKIVEFVDLECPVCKSVFERELQGTLRKYDRQVSLSYIHFPLPMHRFASIAAHAAECAQLENRFSEFVAATFAKQDSMGLRPWSRYAQDAGVADDVTPVI